MSLPSGFEAEIDRRVGVCLIAAAVDVVSEQKRRMSKSFPPASKPGEYLRGRTWNAREGVVYGPTNAEQVGREGKIRIGYTLAAWYAAWWETLAKKKRLGLMDSLAAVKDRVNRWLAAARRSRG